MKAKTRVILEECIETGIVHGYEKAHKHVDNPSRPAIVDAIENRIWLEIDERFDFECESGIEPKSNLSGPVDVTLLKEHEDGSATYQFDLTPEYAEALLQNGIMWAIASGVTGITIDKVLKEYKEKEKI